MILPRRRFLTGLSGLIAAPAVVRAASLMPVKVIAGPPEMPPLYIYRLFNFDRIFTTEQWLGLDLEAIFTGSRSAAQMEIERQTDETSFTPPSAPADPA